MITTPAHALTFGALDLLGHDHSGTYWFDATGDDADFGNPDPVIRSVTSFLMDGAIEATESYGNREMTLRIRITGTSSQGLADGEAALVAEVGHGNVLTWTPPDSTGDFAGDACVFQVVNSSLAFDFDDIKELQLQRIYVLTIKALPFSTSDTLVTTTRAAPAGTTPAVTTVDACTATTGWARSGSTGTVTGPTVVSGAVTGSWANATTVNNPAATLTLTRTGLSVVTTSTPYIRIDYTATGSGRYGSSTNTVKLNGVTVTEVARDGTVAWYPFSGTLTSVAVTTGASVSRYGKLGLSIADISRSDMPQDATGARQVFSTLAVGGSVRTPGTLAVADPTAALGSVLVYTTPITSTAVQPPLRKLRTAGGAETVDASTVSGKTSDMTVLQVFDIPALNVPAGGYLLLARIKNTTGTTYGLSWSGQSVVGTNVLDGLTGPQGIVGGTLVANTWTVVSVGHMTLPTSSLGSAGKVRINLLGSASVLLDEAWLFNMDDGRLTWVECGTASPSPGGSSNRLWIDSADLDTPVPSIWVGNASDRSDSFGAGGLMQSFGAHEFTPPFTNVFVVTTNSVAAALTMTYYPSYHTHVT